MITMTGKYQTRDGRAVRILCVDGPNTTYPVVGFIDGDLNTTYAWTLEGKNDIAVLCPADLIPLPTKHEGWVVLSFDYYGESSWPHLGSNFLHDSPEGAHGIAVRMAGIVGHVTWQT